MRWATNTARVQEALTTEGPASTILNGAGNKCGRLMGSHLYRKLPRQPHHLRTLRVKEQATLSQFLVIVRLYFELTFVVS